MAFREYHQIDASSYLRAIEKELRGDSTLKSEYISKLGRTYGCGISVIVFGEITKRICEIFSKDKFNRDKWLSVLGDFLIKQNIKVITVLEKEIKLFHELRELDYKSDEPELLALAIAINHKADVFMTFDEGLLNSTPLFKQKYKVKVRKPI